MYSSIYKYESILQPPDLFVLYTMYDSVGIKNDHGFKWESYQ